MFGYRFRTFGTGASRLTEGWKASIMSEIGVGDCMAAKANVHQGLSHNLAGEISMFKFNRHHHK